MKKILLILTVLILVSICWMYFSYRSTCEGCGGCGYEEFTDHVLVEQIVCENDSMCAIHLKSIVDNNTYQIYPGEFRRVETNFDKTEITDTSKTYTIYGKSITHGTCEPYGIDKMILYKK